MTWLENIRGERRIIQNFEMKTFLIIQWSYNKLCYMLRIMKENRRRKMYVSKNVENNNNNDIK